MKGLKYTFFAKSGRILKNANASKREFEAYDVPRMDAEFEIARVSKDLEKLIEEMQEEAEKKNKPAPPNWRIYLRLEQSRLRKSFFLRLVSEMMLILIPFFCQKYEEAFNLSAPNADDKMKTVPAIIWVSVVMFCFFFMYMMRQHAEKHVTIAKFRIEQAIKERLFNKLLSSDYVSILKSDPNTMSKILLFGLDNVLNMFVIIPSVLAAPFALVLGCYLVGSLHTHFFFGIAVTVYILMIIYLVDRFNRATAKQQTEYDDIQSLKSIKIEEFFDNITTIQTNSLGDSLKTRFDEIGKRANKVLRRLHLTIGLADLLITLSPFFFTAMSTSIYHFGKIGPSTNSQFIRLMVCAFAPMVIPIKVITDSMYRYRMYKISYQQINEFMDSLRTKGGKKGKETSKRSHKDIAISLNSCFFLKDEITKTKFEDILCPEKAAFSDKYKRFILFRDRVSKDTMKTELSLASDSRKKQEKLKATFQSMHSKNPLSSGDEGSNYCLKNVSFRIEVGQKVCILGDENSGKHDLFLALMRELIEDGGNFHMKGTAVYLDMNNARLTREQIKENILLGRKLDKVLYNDLIRLVGLNLSKYPLKDRTIVVEGQKNIAENDVSRILLVRLLYSSADIYMLNNYFDLLSKDKQIESFKRVVNEYLADKTVIYATNNVHLVKMSNKVLVMRDGRIVENDTYSNLMKKRDTQLYRYLMTDPAGNTNLFKKVLDHFKITIKKKDDHNEHFVSEDPVIRDTGLRRGNSEARGTRRRDSKIATGSPEKKAASIFPPINDKTAAAGEALGGAPAVAADLNTSVSKTPAAGGFKIGEIDLTSAIQKINLADEGFEKGRDLGKLQRDIMYKNSLAKRLSVVGDSWVKYLFYLLCFLLTNGIMLASILLVCTWGTDSFNTLQTYDEYITVYDVMAGVYLFYVTIRDLLFTRHIVNNLDHIYNLVLNCLIDTQKEYLLNNPSTSISYLMTKTIANIDRDYIRAYYKYLDAMIIILCIVGALNYFLYIFMAVITIFLMIVINPVFSTYQNGCIKLSVFTTKYSAELMEIFLSSFNFILPLRNHRSLDSPRNHQLLQREVRREGEHGHEGQDPPRRRHHPLVSCAHGHLLDGPRLLRHDLPDGRAHLPQRQLPQVPLRNELHRCCHPAARTQPPQVLGLAHRVFVESDLPQERRQADSRAGQELRRHLHPRQPHQDAQVEEQRHRRRRAAGDEPDQVHPAEHPRPQDRPQRTEEGQQNRSL